MQSFKLRIQNTVIQIIATISNFKKTKGTLRRVIALHDIPMSSREIFKNKMRWMAENYNIVSLQCLYGTTNLSDSRINVALTFDDGYKEQAGFIASVLDELSIPATFFVPFEALGASGEFSKKNFKRSKSLELMSVSDIKKLSQNNFFTIGGHTSSHIDLGQALSFEDLKREIVDDKKKMEDIIGRKINFFAYPFGGKRNFNDSAIEAVKLAGYSAAFTIIPSFWTDTKNLFLLGRNSLEVTWSNRLWHAMLSGGYDLISILKNYIK